MSTTQSELELMTIYKR